MRATSAALHPAAYEALQIPLRSVAGDTPLVSEKRGKVLYLAGPVGPFPTHHVYELTQASRVTGNSLTGYSCFSPLKFPSVSNGSILTVTLTDYSGMKMTGEI